MGPLGGLTPDPATAARWHTRGAHLAGMASALLLAVLVARFAVTLPDWGRAGPSPPGPARVTAEVTRLVVGLPVCVVAVLLLADRYAFRRGRLVLAAGGAWIVLPAVSDVLAHLRGPAAPVAAAALLMGAAGAVCQPLTVLLFPLCLLPGSASRCWRRTVVLVAAAASVQYAVIWTLGTPGLPGFASPWPETAAGEWAADLLHDSHALLDWVTLAVTVAMTADLARGAWRAPAGEGRGVRGLIATAYPLYVCLLLSDLWGETWTVVARAAGVTLWGAMICLAASRGGMWRLERVTSHRMARAFVLAVLVIAATCAATGAWAVFPATRTAATVIAACCALVAGWVARPVVRHAVLAIERAFYGPRARPHEAVRALAVRLQQAPHPGSVPEQICRSVVEDLGLSGARIGVETRAGPRMLAAAGSPVSGPGQVFPLRHHGQVVGRLEVARDGASTPAERDTELLSLLADQASPALAALRLAEDARAARERLVLAREEERRRLRREIHDGLGPQLAAVRLRLGVAQVCGLPSAADAHLREAVEVLGEALAEVRRITAGLTPATLVDRGLLDATRILAHRLTTDAVRVTVTDPATPLPTLPPAVETAAYRITAEAVTNAVRHAGARGVEVTFTARPGALTVTVTDDGTGFDAGAVPGTGLSSIAERAEEIGGAATIDTAPGGTTVTATLPTTLGDPHE
ncbi:sensor histidine kinase [Nonomuraea wenchangensis]|uniref:Histidine kinase-like ATPase domain-containing protein n=1 Tax=Nonomuraea wenchangensis TaxID=568860 RepID=A0A1I0L750_9ACTN|nr:ATP-binding protein [Nonomuraea wenchangensis]SEU35394.1 Histidine kinase-like ATPase domain-containing protein [Nonomuraea wenchangensis]